MREFAKVAPQFWTGNTGRELRKMGPEVQLIALYLITCPSANMLGLYYLPLPTLCHEIGSPLEGALKALQRVSEGGFAFYDEVQEVVFIPEMARFQIGESLKPNDNRVKGIEKELAQYAKSKYFNAFLEKYGRAYHLKNTSPLEAPSKGVLAQENFKVLRRL